MSVALFLGFENWTPVWFCADYITNRQVENQSLSKIVLLIWFNMCKTDSDYMLNARVDKTHLKSIGKIL